MAKNQNVIETKSAPETKDVPETKNTPEAKTGGEELVSGKLFKDNDRYKGDVFVAVNGRRFQIKRGVEVKLPKYVAEVLAQSAEQDQNTAQLIERESSRFAAEAEKLGV